MSGWVTLLSSSKEQKTYDAKIGDLFRELSQPVVQEGGQQLSDSDLELHRVCHSHRQLYRRPFWLCLPLLLLRPLERQVPFPRLSIIRAIVSFASFPNEQQVNYLSWPHLSLLLALY